MRETIHVGALWSSMVFGLISAGLWFWSARVAVPEVRIKLFMTKKPYVPPGSVEQKAVLKKQSRINAAAAVAAALATVAQIVAQVTDTSPAATPPV